MSEHDITRLIENLSDAQRRTLRAYARRKAAGKGVPAETMRDAVNAVRFAARVLGIKVRGGDDMQAALSGIVARMNGTDNLDSGS